MDVSVVIPSYNRADLLPFTLDAVLAQTTQPREVIVVDDGSSDATLTLLARYQPRVTAIAIRNSGSIAARNAGLRATVGTRVAFCDSDDLWRPDFLERMAALWSAEPRLRVAYSNFHTVRDDVWSAGTKFDEAPPNYWNDLRLLGQGIGVFDQPIVDRVVKWQPFFQSAVVVDRATLLHAGGWDEGVGRTIGDDFGTVLRMAEFVPFGVLFEPLVGIRKHPGNFSANVRAMNLGDANILEYVLATRPSLARHEALIRQSVAQRRRDALESAFSDGDFAAVRAIYERLPAWSISNKLKLKHLLAGLPMPLAAGLAQIFSGARSILR
jgi:glycosyltransferase involved in cell wall biosynthesis